mgnify:FL=1
MDVRPALPSDLPEIAALHRANWRRDFFDVLPPTALGDPLDAYMRRRWHPHALDVARGFVARDTSGFLLGFAAMLDDGPDGCAYLENLHVSPTARGAGVGTALMSAVAVLSIPTPLTLEVLTANAVARAVYRRWGGTESAEFMDKVLDVDVPAVVVSWRDTAALAARLRGG